ncbi:MAG: radical SAM protein [Pseudomonadota bacterium]
MIESSRKGLDFLFVHTDAGTSPLPFEVFLPPLGLIQIATYLNAQGFRSRVVDTRDVKFSLGWFADYLSEARPAWIGFSAYTDTIFAVGHLIEVVRTVSPSSRIAIGGAHATVCDEESLKETAPDVVVRGEGETPCAELLHKSKLSGVKGISFLRRKKIVRTPPPPLLDLDSLPSPDYSVVEGHKEIPYGFAVSTGRGCPYRCAFCAAGTLGFSVRSRSVARVIEDIRAIRKQHGGNYFVIVDDTFTANIRRTEAFCREIKKIGGGSDLFWYAEGRVDRLARRPSILKTMREAGCAFLQFGVESGDQKVIKAYRKNIVTEDSVGLVAACAGEGILTHAGFIVGGPFESDQTLSNTHKLAAKLLEVSRGFLSTRFEYLNPMPATDIFMRPERYGLTLLDPRLYTSVGFDNCVTETESLSRNDIIRRKSEMTNEALAATSKRVLSTDGQSMKRLRHLHDTLGNIHPSLLFLDVKDWKSYFKNWLEAIHLKAERFSQFTPRAGKNFRDLIPARVGMFNVDEGGRYCIPALEIFLSEDESDLFHYCSGKLSSSEIAVILGKKEEEIGKTLLSLENKRIIVYRTF